MCRCVIVTKIGYRDLDLDLETVASNIANILVTEFSHLSRELTK